MNEPVLRPPALRLSVDGDLTSLASQARVIRGAIAYWTIDHALLGPGLAPGLAHPDGFLCVDIHLPTNIDRLAALCHTGAEVRLHLYDLVGGTEDVGVRGLPPHLMHAKMILFDLDDVRAKLWVDSHNATQRALCGINVEASLVLDLDRSTAAYQQAVTTLEAIRQLCDRMDPALVNYYKWLQSGADTESVIELEDASDTPLRRSSITVFGTEPADHRQLGKVNQAVFVSVTSSVTGVERFYPARISQTGEMPKASRAASGTTFDPRRHAFRRGRRLPLLMPFGPIPTDVYREAQYFVTLELQDPLPEGTVAFEVPERARWVDVEDGDQSDVLPSRGTGGRRGERAPRLRRAAPPEHMSFEPMALEARRQIQDHKLVRRRVFVRPGDDE